MGAPTSYAGFWRRFAALFIDSIVLGFVGAAVGFVVGFVMGIALLAGKTAEQAQGALVLIQLINFAIGMGLNVCYYVFLESSAKQATLGKMALGIKVTDLDGNRITPGKAALRFVGKIVSGLILCIGYIMAGFTEKKQALHDTIAGTLVVNAP